jgi:integrase
MRRELTDAYIRTIRPPSSGRLEIWDTKVTGLALRVTASGARSWSVRGRMPDGRQVRSTIGTHPEVPLAGARKRARDMRTDIEAGTDPVAERRAAETQRKARAAAPTVTQRLAGWQDARRSNWSDVYAGDVARFCKNEIIPVLGNRVLAETSRADWTSLVARKRKQSASSAANLYRIASSFLNHSEAAGWVPLPLLPRKGASVLAPAVEARARVLTDTGLAAIWRAADGMAPKPRAFIHLLAMTAARRREVADIGVAEIDMAAATWTIPASRAKNGTAYIVPLHPMLLDDLRAIWPEHDAGPGWRLLGAIKGSGLSGFSKIKSRIDELSGVSDWNIHDLRRTARTGMARLGISGEIAELAINHVSGRSALVRVYDRHDYQPEVLSAVSGWQSHVAALVTAPPSAEILSMQRAR